MMCLSPKAACMLLLQTGLLLSANTGAYVLSSSSWTAGQAEVYVDLEASNPAGSNPPNTVAGGPSTAQLQAAYIEAMALWNSHSTFNYIANTGGGNSDPCVSPGGDPRNGVLFATATCNSSFGSSTLAVQWTWSSGTSRSKTGTVFNNTKQWDLYSGVWTGAVEFKRVALHELGHGLGLNHSGDNNAIMWPTAGNTEVPQTDDIQGIAAFYDVDGDAVGLATDNCPATANPLQSDLDNDNLGDVCDADIDGDGVYNTAGVDASYGLDSLTNSYYSFGPNSSSAYDYRAMTFPVSFSGALTTVTLPVYCPTGDLVLSIQALNGTGKPNGVNLTSKQFTSGTGVPTSSSGAVEFTFDTAANVTNGNSFAIVAQALSSCRWFLSSISEYAGGDGYFSDTGISWFSTEDFPFAATIDPSTIDNCPSLANPGQADLDTDGLGDLCDSDADGDGLSNVDEINTYLTNPLDSDSDNDTYNDGVEVAAGSDPNNPGSVPGSADGDGDINGDGLVDISDILLGQGILLGLVSPTAAQIQRGDVAPLSAGVPAPDGVFDAGDLLVITRKVIGQVSF